MTLDLDRMIAQRVAQRLARERAAERHAAVRAQFDAGVRECTTWARPTLQMGPIRFAGHLRARREWEASVRLRILEAYIVHDGEEPREDFADADARAAAETFVKRSPVAWPQATPSDAIDVWIRFMHALTAAWPLRRRMPWMTPKTRGKPRRVWSSAASGRTEHYGFTGGLEDGRVTDVRSKTVGKAEVLGMYWGPDAGSEATGSQTFATEAEAKAWVEEQVRAAFARKETSRGND